MDKEIKYAKTEYSDMEYKIMLMVEKLGTNAKGMPYALLALLPLAENNMAEAYRNGNTEEMNRWGQVSKEIMEIGKQRDLPIPLVMFLSGGNAPPPPAGGSKVKVRA